MTDFEKIRKIIREEVGKVIAGSLFLKPLDIFDNLKWELNDSQRFFLEDFVSSNPDLLKDADIKYASKFTGIPEKNLLSILNTYGPQLRKEYKKQDYDTRFETGNKPYLYQDFEIPTFQRTDHINFQKISKEELDKKRFPSAKDKWEKSQVVNLKLKDKSSLEHTPFIIKKNFWQYLGPEKDNEIIEHIKSKISPKTAKINHRGLIEIVSEDKFDPYHHLVEAIIEFNQKNQTYYILKDHVKYKENHFISLIKRGSDGDNEVKRFL